MTDWYVSSANYAAVPQWAANTAYTVGQFVRALTPPNAYQQYVYRVTTAGTSGASEPGWTGWGGNNEALTNGGVVFNNVTGQSAYGWSAATNLFTMSYAGNFKVRPVAGDRVFIASDSSETHSSSTNFSFVGTAGFVGVRVISVNRAGSVPPVAADILPGAAVTVSSGILNFNSFVPTYWEGITFNYGGASDIAFNNVGNTGKTNYFKNCAFVLTAASTIRFVGGFTAARVVWDNTTVRFSHASQTISCNGSPFELNWINTPAAIAGATFPTTLFTSITVDGLLVTCRGVDLSAIAGTLAASNGLDNIKVMLDGCKIASAVTRLASPGGANYGDQDEVELSNCFDGTNVINERQTVAGAVTTERTTTMIGGATDGAAFSLKLVSGANTTPRALPLDSFFFDVENAVVGVAKTATVEIISSATLNSDDVRLTVAYLGTALSSVTSFVDSQATSLTSAALPTSSVTWNSPPATPVKQKLQVTFTPQTSGRVRGRVRLDKASTTIYVNPQISIA